MRERIRLWLQSMKTFVRAAFAESEQKGRAIATRRREQHAARQRSSSGK